MKTRYFIFLSFRGTSYHGWQVQPGSESVQGVLEKSLSVVTNEKIAVTGAGRTDAGVHASFYCAHFESDAANLDSNEKFLYRINGYLPKDIAVKEIRKVVPGAHARFSPVSRTYHYFILLQKDPFREESGWLLNGPFDVESMNKACRIIEKATDFTSFSKLHSDNKTNICKVYHAEWRLEDGLLIFEIKADRFLRNMVRAIVGTMARLGKGRISLDEFQEIIKAKDRGKASRSAPAKGLILTDIEYPDEIFVS